MMECEQCGLTPADLPDGTPVELIFEHCDDCGGQFCQPCLYEHEALMAS